MTLEFAVSSVSQIMSPFFNEKKAMAYVSPPFDEKTATTYVYSSFDE